MALGAFLNKAMIKVTTQYITNTLPDRTHVQKSLLVTTAEV